MFSNFAILLELQLHVLQRASIVREKQTYGRGNHLGSLHDIMSYKLFSADFTTVR